MSVARLRRVRRRGSSATFPASRSWWCGSATTSRASPSTIVDPALDETVHRRGASPRPIRAIVTTYYAIDGINFRPADLSSALDTLDAPYLPLVVLEAAGLPLDACVRGAEAHPPALQRAVLSLRQRRRGAALQPAADRRRPDQAALTMPSTVHPRHRRIAVGCLRIALAGVARHRGAACRRARRHVVDRIRLVRAWRCSC